MTTITRGAALAPLMHIIASLRPEDLEEITAVRGEGFNHFEFAKEIERASYLGEGRIAWVPEPVASFGCFQMTPVCIGCWAFGTEKWPLALRAVTKEVTRHMLPGLIKAGFHRAECRALASREDSRRWLTSIGFDAEAVLTEFGVRHENFILYAWTAHATHNLKKYPRLRELPLRAA